MDLFLSYSFFLMDFKTTTQKKYSNKSCSSGITIVRSESVQSIIINIKQNQDQHWLAH